MLSVLTLGVWADDPTSWNNPYLPSAKSGQQYAIRYTTDAMSHDANSAWMKVGYDDSNWTLGAGPVGSSGYGVPSGTAALGTSIDSPSGDRFIRREFTLDRDLSGKTIYMACGHDDEGAIWIDGTQIISWSNVWDDKYVHTMTSEQTALLTKGTHVIAMWAKNNDGGYYWDCGLYGEDLSTNLDWGNNTSWTARYKFKSTGYEGGDPGQNADRQAAVDALTDPDNDVAGYSWTSVNYNDASWETMAMPCGNNYPKDNKGTKWEGYYNCYWFRRSFYLSSIDKNKTYTLENVHDDDYEIYINGHRLAQATGWSDNYNNPVKLSISPEYLQIGENVIAAEVQQNWGGSLFDCKVTIADKGTATFTATGQSVGDASRLFDGNATDGDKKWEGDATYNDNGTLYYATQYALFNASEAIYVNGLTLYTANDDSSNPNRSPRKWKLYGSNTSSASTNSNDGSWQLIQEVWYKMPDTDATPVRFAFNPSQTSYRYFKFEVDYLGGAAWMQVGELELDYSLTAKSPITHLADGGGNTNEGASNLFDGLSTTKWCKGNNASTNYVVFKTTKPIYASSYVLQTANDANGRDPKTFKLYGAFGDSAPTTDGTTTGWTEIDSETDASGTIPENYYAVANFIIDNPGIYQYFMFKVEANRSNDASFQMSEFAFDSPVEVETYTISNATELADYAKRVNAGEDRTIAKVTNDIVADGNFASIGTTTNKFGGIFDGQNHTITINVGSGSEYQGLIGCAENAASISNVIVKGSVAGPSRCGGVLGGSNTDATPSGTVTLLNCGNEANVTVAGQNAGGVVGCNRNGSLVYKLTNCYNTGTIKGGSESAGISGWLKNNAVVTNCYNIGNVTGVDGTKTFARWDSGSYTNCYNTLAANEFAGRTDSYPMSKVTSGELCYKLNSDTNDGTTWTQTIGEDSHPIPFSTRQTVHQANTSSFTNLPVSAGVVQIDSADDLVKFSREVNNGNISMDADVVADIDMTGKGGSWWPIGGTDASDDTNTGDKAYTGTFDGKNHTIDNLVQDDNGNNNQGLFGVVNGGCVIKNLILGSGCHFKGLKYVGALAGSSRGAGWVTIQNCGNEGAVTASSSHAAAIIGCVVHNGPATRITDCYNKGNINGNAESAILTGWFGGHSSVEVNNFYNTGTISGDDGGQLYRNGAGITFNNVYHTSANQNATQIGEGWLTSGELCYKLGASFKQDLSQESYPIPFGTKAVSAGKWFNDTDNDVYYNLEDGNYTVYQLNMSDTNTKYVVPSGVTAKNVSIERTIPEGQWIGLCLPFDYDIPSGWDVRELTSVVGSGESASMRFSTATTIEAGKPYIVKPAADSGVTSITATNKAIATAASTLEEGDVNMIGNFAQTSIPVGSFYINTSSQLKKLNANATSNTLKGFRAYFTVDSNVKALNFDFDDDATGISLTPALSEGEGAIYNVAGQRMNKMQKGINIVNGKKILR